MIKEFIDRYYQNKDILENYYKKNKQGLYSEYIEIVKALINYVINTKDIKGYFLDVNNITVIDNGDYQGTLIFLIPLDSYQPSPSEYLFTYVDYGSCSGCDTLQKISDYEYQDYPNNQQVKDYMTLSLHILQNFKWLLKE